MLHPGLPAKGAHTARATRDNRRMMCSVHECTLVDTIVTFNVVYFNETSTLTNETINIEAWTLPGLPYDIIIGRPTIEKERLLLDNKISLSGELFSFTYNNTNSCSTPAREMNNDTAPRVAPRCLSCSQHQSPTTSQLSPRPLQCGLSDFKNKINTPTFIDPAILADKSTAGTMYSDKIAKAIYKDLRKIAVKQTNETLSILGKEIREGRLRGAAQLHELATPAGSNDTVIAPLQYLYLLNDVDREFLKTEFTRDSKYSIEQYLFLMHGERVRKEELLDPLFDDDTIDYTKTEPPWEQESSDTETKPFKFAPDAIKEHEEGVRNLLQKYDRTFQATLNNKPAVLDPMVLKVNDSAWKVNRNRAPARFMSELKRAEIKRQIDKMLALNLIRPSQGVEKSQVVLAKKPDGSWRFCIDYRELNLHTESMGWPIPNIPQMLQRIGLRKPKFFAVMDLTMGFFQAPLAEESRKYTTFTTWMGTYEWLRVAMGLKGAPSWFQQQLETKVLGGLIHTICELYIDDLIIYADTYEEYLANLEAVLLRFKQHNITVSPKKCQFLMNEIEYVGYVINTEGIRFSPEKKEKALNFPLPTTTGALKQFTGLAEHFHRHVRNFADLSRPLFKMLDGYSKRNRNNKLTWSEKDQQAFRALQTAICDSPTLYFPEPSREIFLETDASDYGIGAYLYQMDADGTKYPIAFISKNLTGSQLNWSVPEKEAFGIFYALQKLEHLLRDVHFVLKTDHKNLTYVNFGNSAKIMRWKLMIQEYDFDIEHVAGEENDIADAFSRLVAMPRHKDIDEVLAHANVIKYVPVDKHAIISKFHNTNVGHFGVTSTIRRLQEAGHSTTQWPQMKEHVNSFVKKCPCCQKMSVLKHPIEHHPFVIASYEPMQKVAVDTIGPLKKDDFGNTHVCVLTDCFSRFTMLIPTKDASAQSAARALLQWCGLFGAPAELLSDMGTQFINHTIDDLLKLLLVSKLDILAGVHEQNSIVERRIKEANRHLRSILFHTKVKEHWSDALPLVQRIMNAQRLLPTGTSPAQIIFGNSINLDSGILLSTNEKEPQVKSKRLSEWTAKMLEMQQDIIKVAQQTQEKSHEDYFRKFSDERTEFPINSYVLVNYGDKQPPSKLHTFWRGPYRVVHQDSIDKNRITVQNLVTNKLEDFPVHQLKPYLDNGIDSPEQVAMTDDPRLHLVEKILSHEGNKNKPSSLKFQVKWEDLPLNETSMESYNSIKNTEPLHDYLTSLGGSWTKLIPMEFTNEGEHYTELHKSKRQCEDSNSSPKKTKRKRTKR